LTKRKIIILLILATVVSAGAVVLAGKWRSKDIYRKVTIAGNYTISDDEVYRMTGLKPEIELTPEQINENELIERLKVHNEIKKVFVAKIPPDELSIQIVEKNPIAIINDGTGLKLIDEELELYPFDNKGKMFDLPIINGINKISGKGKNYSGGKENAELKSAVYILININRESKFLNSCISEINITDDGRYILYSSEKGFPINLPEYGNRIYEDADKQKDLKLRIKAMRNFFENIFPSERSKNISSVDLSFSNQLIIKYEENIN
jgi:hypothetical protein